MPINERTKVNELKPWAAHTSGGPAILRLAFAADCVECDFTGCHAIEAHGAVVRMLGLRGDPSGFEQHAGRIGHARLFEGRSGLRMPLTASLYARRRLETFCRQQVNLNFAYTMRRRLAEKVGAQISENLFSPPQPSAVARLDVETCFPYSFRAGRRNLSDRFLTPNCQWNDRSASFGGRLGNKGEKNSLWPFAALVLGQSTT